MRGKTNPPPPKKTNKQKLSNIFKMKNEQKFSYSVDKKSLTPFLKLQILEAQWVDSGNIFHISTILLK